VYGKKQAVFWQKKRKKVSLRTGVKKKKGKYLPGKMEDQGCGERGGPCVEKKRISETKKKIEARKKRKSLWESSPPGKGERD